MKLKGNFKMLSSKKWNILMFLVALFLQGPAPKLPTHNK